MQHYFGISAEIKQTFPHGFISTKLFPASFCELGIERFKGELQTLPSSVRDAVLQSLEERVKDYGMEYVLPSSMRSLSGVAPAANQARWSMRYHHIPATTAAMVAKFGRSVKPIRRSGT